MITTFPAKSLTLFCNQPGNINAFFLEKNGKAIILKDENLDGPGLYHIFVNLEKENKKLYNDLKYKKIDFNT